MVWVFGSVILQFVFGFAAALLLQQAFTGRALVRTLTLCLDYPGSGGRTDLAVAISAELRRHQ